MINAEKLLRLYQVRERDFLDVELQDAIELLNTDLSQISFSNFKFVKANFEGSKLENSNFY